MTGVVEPKLPESDCQREAWLARYLAGTLPDAEAARVEAYWARHPELTQELERIARLTDGLRALRARGELDAVVRGSWWTNRLSLLAVAAGVSTVAAGVLAWWLTTARPAAVQVADTLAGLQTEGRPLALGATVSLLRLRSAGADATLVRPAADAAVAVRVLPEDGGAGPYRLRLRGIEGAAADCGAGEFDGLRPPADGFVTAYVASAALCSGTYRIELSGVDAARSSFTLDVVDDTAPRS